VHGLVHPDLCPDNLLFLGGGVGCVDATEDDACSLFVCFAVSSLLAWLSCFAVSAVFIGGFVAKFSTSFATPCFFIFSGNFGGCVVVVVVGVGGLVVNGCLSKAIFDSLVISLFVTHAGDFGAAQLEFELDLLKLMLFFDPPPKPRMPQLHFLVDGGDGRARLLMSEESVLAVSDIFALPVSDSDIFVLAASDIFAFPVSVSDVFVLAVSVSDPVASFPGDAFAYILSSESFPSLF